MVVTDDEVILKKMINKLTMVWMIENNEINSEDD